MNSPIISTPHDPADSVYTGFVHHCGDVVVYVDGRDLHPDESLKLRNHSPTGFQWGYAGSGPAQLALALLLHATRGNRECAIDLYQRYKRDVVSQWEQSGWVTTRAQILRWIGEQPGHLDGRVSAAEGGEL